MLRYDKKIKEKFDDYCETIKLEKKLNDREFSIVELVNAMLSNDKCELKSAVLSAKEAGLTSEEISYINGLLIMKKGELLSKLEENGSNENTQRVCCS